MKSCEMKNSCEITAQSPHIASTKFIKNALLTKVYD